MNGMGKAQVRTGRNQDDITNDGTSSSMQADSGMKLVVWDWLGDNTTTLVTDETGPVSLKWQSDGSYPLQLG